MTRNAISNHLKDELQEAMKLIKVAGDFTEAAENIAILLSKEDIDEDLRAECECFVTATQDLASLYSLTEYC